MRPSCSPRTRISRSRRLSCRGPCMAATPCVHYCAPPSPLPPTLSITPKIIHHVHVHLHCRPQRRAHCLPQRSLRLNPAPSLASTLDIRYNRSCDAACLARRRQHPSTHRPQASSQQRPHCDCHAPSWSRQLRAHSSIPPALGQTPLFPVHSTQHAIATPRPSTDRPRQSCTKCSLPRWPRPPSRP